MAKKAVASLQKRGAKDFTKVIKMTKNQKNGAYSFKQEIVHKDQVNDYLAKSNHLNDIIQKLLSIFERSFFYFKI